MIRQVICPVCGSNFTTTDHRRKYCSDECYKKAQKSLRSKRYWENPEEKRKYSRNYYWEHSNRIREQHQKYYYSNREKILKRQRKYYQKYYWDHREEILSYKKLHSQQRPKQPTRKSIVGCTNLKDCIALHNNCFSCPSKDGECLFD